MQHQPLGGGAFAQRRLADEHGGVLRRLAFVNLPADDLAAVDVHHQVEAIEPPRNRGGQVGDVPAPHLVRATGLVACGLAERAWRLRLTAVVQLIGRAQDAVEARLRGEVAALVGEARDDLRGGQAGVLGLIADRKDLLSLLGAELVGRRRALGLRAPIGLDARFADRSSG
jgi:hypothetical protein